MTQFQCLLCQLPLQCRTTLDLLWQEELGLVIQKTSAGLQQQCTLLYLIAYLDVPHSFTDSIVPLICEITFEAKFMIHEKYYACLYLNVLRYLPRLLREDLSKDI